MRACQPCSRQRATILNPWWFSTTRKRATLKLPVVGRGRASPSVGDRCLGPVADSLQTPRWRLWSFGFQRRVSGFAARWNAGHEAAAIKWRQGRPYLGSDRPGSRGSSRRSLRGSSLSLSSNSLIFCLLRRFSSSAAVFFAWSFDLVPGLFFMPWGYAASPAGTSGRGI